MEVPTKYTIKVNKVLILTISVFKYKFDDIEYLTKLKVRLYVRGDL